MAVAAQYPNLESLFNSGNWGAFDPTMQQQDTAQSQANANLAGTIQDQSQSAAMFPYKQATEAGLANQYNSNARLSNANAATHEDALKILQSIPTPDRVKTAMAENTAKMSTAQQATLDNEMKAAAVYAAKGISNGGKLSLSDIQDIQQNHPDLLRYTTSPNGIQQLAQAVNAHNALGAERQQAESTARIHAGATLGAASIGANAALKSMQMQIDAGRFNNHSLSFQELKQMSTLPGQIGVYESKKNQAIQIMRQTQPGSPEYIQAQQAAQQYADSEQKARDQHAILGSIAAAVQGGKSADITALGQGFGLTGITPPSAPRVTPPPGQPTGLPTTPQQPNNLPQAAISQLKEGTFTTFRNGQVWTLKNGQPTRVK